MLDADGKEIDRIDDTLDLDLGTEEKDALDEVPLSFQGRLILPPEHYRLEFLLTNTTGGGTETASVPVEVRDMEGAGASEILLARSRARLSRGELIDDRPFQLEELIVSPSPDHVFPATQTVAYLQIWGSSETAALTWSLSRGDETVWESSAPLTPSHGSAVTVEQVVPLENLPDGVYTLLARFPGGSRRTQLTVDSSATVPSVRVLSREALPAGHGRIRFQRGVLYSKRGDTEKAIEEMAEAARLLPRDLEVHLNLAYLLTATSQHQRVLDLLKPIEPHYPTEVDLLVFMAFASLKLGRYEDAVSYYEKALAQRPRDERIKKALEEARKAGTKGEINPKGNCV
jgi:tetratricopeptide (TPR) repeat protein